MDTQTQPDSLSRLYARALFEMAQEKGDLDAMGQEVRQLGELLAQQGEFGRLLTTPVLNTAGRRELIDRVFKGRVSDVVYRFLQVVNEKDRLGALPGIFQAFDEQMDASRGIVEVDVHVAHRLDAEEVQQVSERIGQALGKEIVLHQYVDASLIGGLVIRVGDQLIDGSVAAQLRAMRRRLVDAGRRRKGPRE